MKPILPFVLALFSTLAIGQNTNQSTKGFTGTWKVELLCNENYCQGPTGITEKATGTIESQTWTITQQDNGYVLRTGVKQHFLDKGVVSGNELRFDKFVSGTSADSAQQVVLTVDKKGKLVGKLNVGPKLPGGVCIKRYTVTGQH